jgi:hypothetical protein
MSNININILAIIMFSLSIVGLIGFTLAPYRAYEYCHFLYQKRFNWQLCFGIPIICFLMYAWSALYYRVIFKCLAEAVCGGDQSMGIMLLALFGCIVLTYEVVRLVVILLYKRMYLNKN